MLKISSKVNIPLSEIEINAIRAQGSGGQNVNKVATAVHLRFDVGASSLPDLYKERLVNLSDQRISKEGIVVIKAQRHRSLDKNRDDALARLAELVKKVLRSPKKRKPTKPTRGSRTRRLDAKSRRGRVKALREKVTDRT